MISFSDKLSYHCCVFHPPSGSSDPSFPKVDLSDKLSFLFRQYDFRKHSNSQLDNEERFFAQNRKFQGLISSINRLYLLLFKRVFSYLLSTDRLDFFLLKNISNAIVELNLSFLRRRKQKHNLQIKFSVFLIYYFYETSHERLILRLP